jgi:hypothetical protein
MSDLIQSQKTGTQPWFKVVLFAGMLLFAFHASTHMVAAGDTWVAMACGRHFSNHGVDTVEPFSFNSHPPGPSEETLQKFPEWTRGIIKKWHPTGWINQNWLTHQIFYKLATWFGDSDSYNYNTLIYWKFTIYFLAVFCVYGIGKLLGAGDFLSSAAACFAMLIGRTFYDVRPSGYSNLLVPVLILVLTLAVYRNYRLIWLTVPIIVFWANVHGGYLYAFIMMVPFVGIHLLLRLPKRWTICTGFIALWLVMYLMSYKFISNNYYLQVQNLLGKSDTTPILFKDKVLIIWVILAVVSILLTTLKNIPPASFYGYHIGTGIVYFLSIAPRFFLAEIPSNLTPHFKEIYSSFISGSQISFLFVSVVGVLLILAMALKKERFITLPIRGIFHAIGAGIVSFIAMIVFNPFHLTNLTHTFEISVSKHAESWRQVNEWKPAFDWMDKTSAQPNPVGNEEAFAVLCILTGVVMLLWLVGHFLKPKPDANRKKQSPETQMLGFEWPKIDLAIIVISLLTIYMAIRSRRFIAIAGPAATPAVFLLALQSWQMFSARFSWNKRVLQAYSPNLTIQRSIQYATFLTVLGFGIFWGMKYKRIYLDAWPTDDRYNDVFMRMTASHLKPFEVCQFINDNDIKGHVFNYWTEGGAVAFGQNPDPETGQIPLKLFMDGRAQAAYNHNTFRLWQTIHAGGSIARKTMMKDGKISPEKMKEIGKWIDQQLKQYDVWVILMPKSQEGSTFMRAVRQQANWKTAFIDNTQHLMVNIQTPQGKDLIDKILNDTAVFPDSYSKSISTSTAIFENNDRQRTKDLYPMVKSAFDQSQDPTTTLSMIEIAKRIPGLREKIIEDLQAYLDGFIQDKDAYQKKDGYSLRLKSAEISARFLSQFDPEEKERLTNLAADLRTESHSLSVANIW